jgi:transcriptional regulator with XRE-family HTH domain
MGTRRKPVSDRVRQNLAELRDARRVHLRALAGRLAKIGHPILASGLSKIETGSRRVDVDDLLALAVALDVSPNRLLLPAEADDEDLELTAETVTTRRTAWRWASGDDPLPVDLWTERPSTVDLNRHRRWRRENRPHDPRADIQLAEIQAHQDALSHVVRAVRAAQSEGLTLNGILHYVRLADTMHHLAVRLAQQEGTD